MATDNYPPVLARIEGHIQAILGEVEQVEDPAQRTVVSREVYNMLGIACARDLGSRGIRGKAASEAVDLYGSFDKAAQATGDPNVTRATMIRLVESYRKAQVA